MTGLLKWLPFLARFAGVAKWFSWLPGGQLIGIAGALAGLVVSFFRWLVRDIEDAFKEPQRLLVRLACLLAVLAVGVHQGIEWDAHKVDAAQARAKQSKDDADKWQAAHNKLLADAKKVDADDKQRHDKAMAAKLKAESDERAKIAAEKTADKTDRVERGLVADHAAKQPADEPAVRVRGGAAERKAARCKKRSGESLLFGLQPVFGGALSCKSV